MHGENKKEPPACMVCAQKCLYQEKHKNSIDLCYSFVANHCSSYLRISIHSHAELSYQYFYLLLVSSKYPKTYFPWILTPLKKKKRSWWKLDEIRFTCYNRHGSFSHKIFFVFHSNGILSFKQARDHSWQGVNVLTTLGASFGYH